MAAQPVAATNKIYTALRNQTDTRLHFIYWQSEIIAWGTRRQRHEIHEYNFTYESFADWMYLDIGFAIVEKPYNFSDLTYRFYCSYVPTPIKINMDPKYVTIGTNAMVYGWGHILDKSEPYNLQDRNTEYLYSARTKITEKKVCYDAYGHENVTNIIMDYMICCKGRGLLNEYGNPDEADPEFADGRSRRNMKNSTNNFIKPSRNENLYNGTNIFFYSRKQGICQNDHGTPLVTWIGREEYVLGVACTSLIRSTFKCLSPYLYTSTQCTSRFIRCAMLGYGQTPMRRMCDDLGKEEGYEIFETKLDWGQGDGYNENKTNNEKNSEPSLDEDGFEMFKFNPDDWDNETNINDFVKLDVRTEEEDDPKDDLSDPTPTGLAYILNFDSVTDDVILI